MTILQLHLIPCICCHTSDVEIAFFIHIKGGVAVAGVIHLNTESEKMIWEVLEKRQGPAFNCIKKSIQSSLTTGVKEYPGLHLALMKKSRIKGE